MLRTFSKYVHGGVIFNHKKDVEMVDNYGYSLGQNNGYCVFDASESRGSCDWAQDIRDWGSREIEVYDIPDPESKGYEYALEWVKGLDYDYFGVGFFGFFEPKKKLYCFEAVRRILLSLPVINGSNTRTDLLPEQKGYSAKYLRKAMKKANINPEYTGAANKYVITNIKSA